MSIPSLRERNNKRKSTSFAAIAKEVDPENDDLILHRRSRLIPLSKSPFFDKLTIEYRTLKEQRRQSSYHGRASTPGPLSTSGDYETYAGMLTADEVKDVDKSNDEERGERPPAWLDLFYDLAWASTFSNLTQNNTISGGEESLSYAVFFSMVWWMWVSQVSYDIRFYSNDWFHRCFVFLQLCVFGALAAFTSKFNVTAYVGRDDSDPAQRQLDLINGLSQAQIDADRKADERYPQLAFFGIALVIGISRFLLCVQYIRVWFYAHDKRDPAVVVKPLAMIISSGLWFGSFAMLYTAQTSNDAAQISKFIMWGVATAIEVAGHAFAPPPGHLRSMGSLTARLATLVTIILGEGLNAITGTLRFSVQSMGFNARSGGLVLATAVVVYLTFYLYFEGTRPRISKNRRSLWICLHLPYMLCLILLLEGLTNLLLYSTLSNSYIFVIETVNKIMDEAGSNTDQLNTQMTEFLANIGFSWQDAWRALLEAAGNGTAGDTELYIETYRMLLNITVKVFEQFEQDETSPAGKVAIHQYLTDDSLVLLDLNNTNLPSFMKVVNVLAQPQVQGARWISALAGGTLLFLALINVTQSWPKDRYAWGSVISRTLNGLILVSLLFMNIGGGDYDMGQTHTRATIWAWFDSYWTLPTLALSLVAQAIVDHILLFLSVRSADKALERSYEPSMLDPLRDSKDHAYDPPMATPHFTSTPGHVDYTSPTPAPQGNWQPSYVPGTPGPYVPAGQQHSQQHTSVPQYASPPAMQRQSSYGFTAPPPPPPFPGSGGSGIPAGGIVTPSRPQ